MRGGWSTNPMKYFPHIIRLMDLQKDLGNAVAVASIGLLAWRTRMTRRPAVRAVVSAMASWLKAAGRPVPAFMLAA